MLTVFNRKSLWIGFDADRFQEIRSRLDAAGIVYRYRVHSRLGGTGSRGGSMRGSYGSFGMRSEAMYQYEIFVHRRDLERARYVMR